MPEQLRCSTIATRQRILTMTRCIAMRKISAGVQRTSDLVLFLYLPSHLSFLKQPFSASFWKRLAYSPPVLLHTPVQYVDAL